WLDFANAYGSLPHKLIEEAMCHYFIPRTIQDIIKGYLSNIKMRFSVGNSITSWQGLCTISVTLFLMAMNLIIESAQQESRGPNMNSGITVLPIRSFIDDLTVTTTTQVQARWVLRALDTAVKWARMKFKPQKWGSLVIRRGEITDRFGLSVQGEQILSITAERIKCLGKWFDATLKDTNNTREVEKQTLKVWLYQYGLLPRLLWPLMLYEIATTTVEFMERKINSFLEFPLALLASVSSRSSKLQLPILSLVEEFKVANVRLAVGLRVSKDDSIRKAKIQTRSGSKWNVASAVESAESQLKYQKIIGQPTVGRQGLVFSGKYKKKIKESSFNSRRDKKEGRRGSKPIQLGKQETWARWETTDRKLAWKDWKLEPLQIQFLLRSVYDVLPTPSNLHRWGPTESPLNTVWKNRQGRYRWRHDKLLRSLALNLDTFRKGMKPQSARSNISFIKAGEKSTAVAGVRPAGILQRHFSRNWSMEVDLDKRHLFPDIVQTNLRPDVVMSPSQRKVIILIELTVPWEERCQEAFERKKARYAELVDNIRSKGWKVWSFPVEVGCRDFPAPSLWRMFGELGISGKDRNSAVQQMIEAAEKDSCWL
uniref:Reverse transcriptase domain-containing protein n=1 Tax=Lepisosteus oculatus TaxID=7918 RepID=W5NEB6_LEPOC